MAQEQFGEHEFGEYGAFVDGADVEGRATFEVFDPATSDPIATVAESGEAVVADAVAAAERALPSWAETNAAERGRVLRSVADALRANADRLARIETAEGEGAE